MIPITTPYEYTKLDKKEFEDGARLYRCPSGTYVPSVTTILDKTSDKTHLIKWRERLGDAEADRQSKHAADLGTLMHAHLENYIQGIERPGGTNHIRVMARNMADVIINRSLVQVDEIWGIEKQLYFPDLYAGTADLILKFNGTPAIGDYKTTKKPKKREWIEGYFCQLTAYILAHNELYGTDIKTGVIFMVSRDCDYQEFILEGNEFEKMKDEWYRRVEMWYSMNG